MSGTISLIGIGTSKAKYMKISRNITNLEQDLIMDLQVFEGVQNFRSLATLIHSKNLISD
jgi:hypothetical protein